MKAAATTVALTMTDDEVLAAFAALPLWAQLRELARVGRVVDEMTPERNEPAWHPTAMLKLADRLEAEDAAVAARERLRQEVARQLYSVFEPPDALAWDGNTYKGHQTRYMKAADEFLDRFDITPKGEK
jgi:HAMP domain-containing protein